MHAKGVSRRRGVPVLASPVAVHMLKEYHVQSVPIHMIYLLHKVVVSCLVDQPQRRFHDGRVASSESGRCASQPVPVTPKC